MEAGLNNNIIKSHIFRNLYRRHVNFPEYYIDKNMYKNNKLWYDTNEGQMAEAYKEVANQL